MRVRLIKGVGSLFALMAGASIGFITMASFMIVFPQLGIGWALAAGISGGLTEGEVYWGGVRKSFKNFFTRGPWGSLAHSLEKREIRRLLKDSAERDHLKTFMEDIKKDSSALTELGFSKKEIEILKKAKATQFVKILLTKLTPENSKGSSLLTELYKVTNAIQSKAFQKKLKRKQALVAIALFVGFGTAVGFGAITFTHVAAGVAALAGVGALTATAPLWIFLVGGAFAAFAGVAYGLLMYHMLAKAIETDMIQRCKETLKKTFIKADWSTSSRRAKIIHGIHCILRALMLLSIIALSVLVTLATAGAWLNSSIQFFSFIGNLSFDTLLSYSSILGNLLIWGFFFPVTLMFTIENSIVSVEKMWSKLLESISTSCRESWNNLKLRFREESWLQFFNPFRFIAAALNSVAAMVALIVHVIASGVIPGEGSDDALASPTKLIPDVMMTGFGAVSEFLADFHFVAHMDEHEHGSIQRDDLDKDAAESCDHHHSLASMLILPVTLPLRFVGFVWHNLARKQGVDGISFKTYMKLRYAVKKDSAPTDSPKAPRVTDCSREERVVLMNGKAGNDGSIKTDNPLSLAFSPT